MDWQAKMLDGATPVLAYEVKAKEFPAGMNVTMIDNVRALLHTPDGLVEIQIGDWIVRTADGNSQRLPYDEAARRLS